MNNNNSKFNSFDKEQWKYTNINQFKHFKYDSPLKNQSITQNKSDIQINNGKLISNKSKNIIADDINNIFNENLYNIQNINNIIDSNQSNPFIKINSENYNNGTFIYIKDNSSFENPIVINNYISKNKKNNFLNEKILILIGNNVNVQLIFKEHIYNQCNLNTVIQIYIGDNSIIDFINDSEKPKTTQICNLFADINLSSELNLFPININSQLIKRNYFINLNKNHSQCHIYSLNLLKEDNHMDNFININHSAKHTISTTYQKNILTDKSKCIFYAKAKICKNSSNSEVFQINNNLVLSDYATVHSNPQLEIHNNDVKCSHGSTTGELDENILFYMRSRGINLLDCKKLILSGFADSIINNIKNELTKNSIKQTINNWLLDVN